MHNTKYWLRRILGFQDVKIFPETPDQIDIILQVPGKHSLRESVLCCSVSDVIIIMYTKLYQISSSQEHVIVRCLILISRNEKISCRCWTHLLHWAYSYWQAYI